MRSKYNREYREKNYLQIAEKRREYYRANRDKISERNQAYKARQSREVILARRARWAAKHRERETARYHSTRAFLPWKNSLQGSKQRAKKHNIPFALTEEWAVANWTGRCAVTNIEFILSDRRSPYLFSPSLDRIEPSKGYTPENSRFVLHAVNALKGAGTDADMLLIAQAIISENQKLEPDKL